MERRVWVCPSAPLYQDPIPGEAQCSFLGCGWQLKDHPLSSPPLIPQNVVPCSYHAEAHLPLFCPLSQLPAVYHNQLGISPSGRARCFLETWKYTSFVLWLNIICRNINSDWPQHFSMQWRVHLNDVLLSFAKLVHDYYYAILST